MIDRLIRFFLPLLPLLLVALAMPACAEEETARPAVDACSAPNPPAGCPCAASRDCWADQCCLPSDAGDASRCVAFETFPPAACLPRTTSR